MRASTARKLTQRESKARKLRRTAVRSSRVPEAARQEIRPLCAALNTTWRIEKVGCFFTPRGRPLALCFTGRAEGKEAVTCGRHSLHVPFGWFTHFQHAVPQAPDLSWARRVKEWAKPEGVPIQLRIAGEAPWERIYFLRIRRPPRGYRQAEMKAILSGNSQELLNYLTGFCP